MATELQKDPRFSADNLIWVDMEMTGLQPEVNRVIEVAAVITDAQLNVIHECPVLAIHQSSRIMGSMDAWNTETHGRSGLIDRVLTSDIDEEKASDILLAEFARFVPQGKSPDVRQFHWTGQTLYGAMDAKARKFFSLQKY